MAEKTTKGIDDEGEEDTLANAAQVSQEVILRGYDATNHVATFALERSGKIQELEVEVTQREPGFSRYHETLMKAMEYDGRVPSLRVHLAIPADGSKPQLLMVMPAAPERDVRFKHPDDASIELRWTDNLDEAVDVDFDWFVQQEASRQLCELNTGTEAGAQFVRLRELAKELYAAEAARSGIQLSAAEASTLFEEQAPRNFTELLRGQESGRAVRYDIRHGFSKQSAHAGNREQKLAGLINYASQLAASEILAQRALSDVPLGDGKTGSLADLHQQRLVGDHMLIAANPSFAAYRDTFAAYSHEVMRTVASRMIAGAMDVAGVPAARPEIDVIELEKKHGDPSTSGHLKTLESLPEGLEKAAPEDRAKAYLGTSSAVAEMERNVSLTEVGHRQRDLRPKLPPHDKLPPNAFAEHITGGIKAAEGFLEGLSM